ncbi:MAG: mannose-6-phosphate isomerase, class I [Trueperella sp.]|nr:mannose-6-phosphate isomerase, class I [Trueperella sp.]
MKHLQGRIRDYAWGSPAAIPKMFGFSPMGRPIAELWLGAHPASPSRIGVAPNSAVLDLSRFAAGDAGLTGTENFLDDYIAQAPEMVLGEPSESPNFPQLPYLLKIISADTPLSLQVHPSKAQATAGYDREDAAGIELCSPERSYQDRNHKPELLCALSDFEAIVGFRTPRRIVDVLSGLGVPLANQIAELIRQRPNAAGVRNVFAYLLGVDTPPNAAQIHEVIAACAERDPAASPSPRADAIVVELAKHYGEDPGVVASLLLNPVSLQPGEAIFVPAGTVHAYLRGTGVEIMAASDNVLRAGLTPKYVDVSELMKVVETVAAPPIRIAPEQMSPVQQTFYAPVDDFELSLIELRDANRLEHIRGAGPRILLCLTGAAQVVASETLLVNTGQAVFLDAADGPVSIRGAGRFVLAAVP